MRKILAGLLPVALLLAGCYTVLRHPQVADREPQEVRNERCVACHSDSDLDDIEYGLHRYGYRHGYGYSPWERYYYNPWWYDDLWYWSPGGGGVSGGGPPAPPGTRVQEGEGLRNDRPPVLRRGEQPPRAPAEGKGTPDSGTQPSGPRSGQRADNPSPPKSADPGKQNPSGPESGPQRQQEGQGMPNDRPPRPHP